MPARRELIVDDVGRAWTTHEPCRRIVSLVPSLTEALFELGVGERVVGVTRYCVEPSRARDEARVVGGTKNPEIDAMIALVPDVVIVNAEENRKPDVDALEAAGVPVFVTFPKKVADVPWLLDRIASLVGAIDRGTAMANALRFTLAEHEQFQARVRVFCPIWKNPWMTFNADTYADDLLRVCGGANVMANASERYLEVSLDEIATADPEVILLPDEPYCFREKDLMDLKALESTTAWRDGRVHFVDGKSLHWYGCRTARALMDVSRLLRPRAASS